VSNPSLNQPLISARRISQPLQEMRQGAERFAAGDFSHRLPLPDSVELASLALTLNRMAAQLAEQIAVIMQQRNEQEAILESMHEGVLALDTQERVITVNRAAEALLGVMVTQAILFRNWFSRCHCSQSVKPRFGCVQ